MKIAIMGFGTVGSGAYENAMKAGGIEVVRILARHGRDGYEHLDDIITANIEDIAGDPEIELVIESIGGVHPAREYVLACLNAGKHVVTPNKNLISACYKELMETADANGVKLRFTSSVGGGIPWLFNLMRVKRCDEILQVRGIVNGTCNFILDAMHDRGADFAEMLRIAQTMGYAEADPSADIEGTDTLRKTVISANLAFDAAVSEDEVPCCGIDTIKACDVAYLEQMGLVCKLMMKAEKKDSSIEVYVEPTAFPEGSLEANVKSNNNLITLTAKYLGEQSYFGQGAGMLPTGQSVIQDVLDIRDGKEMEKSKWKDAFSADNSKAVHRYYIRSDCMYEDIEPIIDTYEEEDGIYYCISKPVAVEEMHAIGKCCKENGREIFFAALTEQEDKEREKMLKVLKFGGSSLADSSQFAKVKAIVESDSSREVVIVSAPGKRSSNDNKITDMLYLIHAHIKYGVAYDGILSMIKARYVEIKEGCGLDIDIASIIDETFAGVDKNTSVDFLASRGEYFSARLMAEYLGYQFVDAVDWLCFDYNGKVNFAKSEEKLKEIKSIYGRMVTPGFYGAMANGDIKVFPRGGSDITGALAACYLGADIYENWTDVSGILMADPRIVKDPKTIARVTYDELRELSYMGASVLHEDTVFPLRVRDIPVNIRNTNAPDDPGTIIREHFDDELEEETERFITGIAGKRSFSIINIYKNRIGEEKLGLLRQVLEVFARYDIPVEQIPSGVDSFSVVFPSERIRSRKNELIHELSELESIDNVDLTEGISLIAIVGRQMAYRTGISGKIFKTLGENNINIRTIEQGAYEINIMIGVFDEDFEKAIRVLYESFAKK